MQLVKTTPYKEVEESGNRSTTPYKGVVLIYLIFYFKLLGFVCLTQLSFSVSARS